MQPTNEWGPANSADRERHVRYQGDFLPLICMDPTLLGKLMGSNISNLSNISEAEMTKRLGGLTPAQSEAVLQIIASSNSIAVTNKNGTPANLSPAASLLALAKSNGSFSQLQGKKRMHTSSECSEVWSKQILLRNVGFRLWCWRKQTTVWPSANHTIILHATGTT